MHYWRECLRLRNEGRPSGVSPSAIYSMPSLSLDYALSRPVFQQFQVFALKNTILSLAGPSTA